MSARMVGGRDFEDCKFNRATQALRQAGSTFKPFVYAAAIRAGYPLADVMDDELAQLSSTRRTRPGSRRTTTTSSKGR